MDGSRLLRGSKSRFFFTCSLQVMGRSGKSSAKKKRLLKISLKDKAEYAERQQYVGRRKRKSASFVGLDVEVDSTLESLTYQGDHHSAHRVIAELH